MRDDTHEQLVIDRDVDHARTATIIPFPARKSAPRLIHPPGERLDLESVLSTFAACLGARANAHGPTALAALGAVAGFAAQQKLLVQGGTFWTQPQRAEHLDRMLIGGDVHEPSLWQRLKEAAHAVGAQHLPDPDKLLQSTLRCVGTTQFGQITLPLEYKLLRQPQDQLADIWQALAASPAARSNGAASLHEVFAGCCARRVSMERRTVPPHVSLRIVMQAALAMALIEPRLIPGACLKPQCA